MSGKDRQSESLETHVALCHMRYAWQYWDLDMARTLKDHEEVCQERMRNIKSNLDSIDAKIDEIHKEIDGFKTFLIQLAFKSFMGLILAISAAVFVIKL
jgi:hypothetical protein